MDYLKLIVSNQKEESISIQKVQKVEHKNLQKINRDQERKFLLNEQFKITVSSPLHFHIFQDKSLCDPCGSPFLTQRASFDQKIKYL